MSRSNIYTVPFVTATLTPNDLTKIIEYLITNVELFLSREETDALFKERSMASTPMSKLFLAYTDAGASDIFSLVAFKARTNLHIPETLTHKHVVLDANQISSIDPSVAKRVLITPELNKKIISNVTQVVSSDGRYFHLKDQERFHSQVVRDCLSRSYFASATKPNWVRTSVLITLAKTYSLLLANNIARWFGVDSGSQDFITLVFASFFLLQCSNLHDADGIIRTKHKEFYVRDRDIVNLSLDKFKDVLGKPLPESIDECFMLIKSIGIARLSVNRPVLYSKLRTIGDDLPTTAIALEYPPYFAWACLNALSGAKNQLNLFIKKQNLMKELQRATGELIQAVPSLS